MCLFEFVEALGEILDRLVTDTQAAEGGGGGEGERRGLDEGEAEGGGEGGGAETAPELLPTAVPQHRQTHWSLSPPLTLKKSLFLARATAVSTPEMAQSRIAEALAASATAGGGRRLASATHNITAYRLRVKEVEIAEYDDDGEAGAGKVLLGLMQEMGVCGVLVVVSRWYGWVKLGGGRFRAVRRVGRDALEAGGWTRDTGGMGGRG